MLDTMINGNAPPRRSFPVRYCGEVVPGMFETPEDWVYFLFRSDRAKNYAGFKCFVTAEGERGISSMSFKSDSHISFTQFMMKGNKYKIAKLGLLIM